DRSDMFIMRVPQNGVFRKWPGRVYDGGNVTIVDLVESNEVYVEEMDSVMVDLGYEAGKTNHHYFLKLGSNLDHVEEEVSTGS
nr:transposase, MuDR, MULE transposase domain protein [Tanacetum cinerariifolium]